MSFEIETKKPNGNVLVVKISVSLKISDENRVNFSAEYDNGIFVHRLEDFERFQKAQVRAAGI